MGTTFDQEFLGEEVRIIIRHAEGERYKDGGEIHEVGERARIYLGSTYECLGPTEEALIFNNSLPFIGTERRYFERVEALKRINNFP